MDVEDTTSKQEMSSTDTENLSLSDSEDRSEEENIVTDTQLIEPHVTGTITEDIKDTMENEYVDLEESTGCDQTTNDDMTDVDDNTAMSPDDGEMKENSNTSPVPNLDDVKLTEHDINDLSVEDFHQQSTAEEDTLDGLSDDINMQTVEESSTNKRKFEDLGAYDDSQKVKTKEQTNNSITSENASSSEHVAKLGDCSKGAVVKPDPCTDLHVDKRATTQPGKPSIIANTIDHVVIGWDPPTNLFEDHSFQLRYKEYNNSKMKWRFYPETLLHTNCTMSNLKSGTFYVFQVRMVDDDMEGPYSPQSDPVETIVSAAEHALEFMYDVENPNSGMPLKRLPLHENKNARNNKGKTRKLYIGDSKGVYKKERTILLVGATGTGKSTLVDGMMNYIFGVKWSDPYRLTLVDLEDDEQTKHEDQAVSQTQWITCYSINPFSGGRLDYKLNIIDTPGFGDTRGIDRDKEIVQQIKELFSRDDDAGVLFIDAICFIIKAPDARLTPTQMYIFNAIMSLFGQDIENNFSMLITFADGKQPPVLSALKKANLPHEEYFPFNNSGLFARNTSSTESEFASMFWNMGCKSFENFFKRLATMETKSLIQTRDVLTQRETIELTMENLIPLVDAGLNKVEETRIEIAILNDFKSQIEANKDFTYTVTETQQQQIDLPRGQHTTNCLNCHFTCHESCAYGNDEDKMNCCAMSKGYCTQCPDKCKWDIHRNTPYIFKYISVTKEKTYAEKLDKYRRAEGETMTREKVVERMHEEMCDLEDEILDLMGQINKCNNILRQIALRPDPLSLVEHIDLLIESEKQEKRPGFQRRIASLQHCRRKATIGDEIDRFDAGLTATTSTITAQVKLPVKRQRKSRNGILGFFQPVVNYFMK